MAALEALFFVRNLDITVTWGEVQDMPEDWFAVWRAFGAGEARAQREKTG
jgi:hypothetical protein